MRLRARDNGNGVCSSGGRSVFLSNTDTWSVLSRAGCVDRAKEGEMNKSWTGSTLLTEEKGETSSVRRTRMEVT